MSEFYIGQVMMTGFGFAQKYFAQCNGQLLPIAQNQALFSLLGVTYGGDGRVTFALPDLRSRTPIGGIQSQNSGWSPPLTVMGQMSGTETVTLLLPDLPAHTHMVVVNSGDATSPGTGRSATNLTLATAAPNAPPIYGSPSAPVPLGPTSVGPAGGSQPHTNIQPFETINFNIALQGIFPSRN